MLARGDKMPEERCAVVGAGLTGLVAAYRLAQAGLRVAVFERYPEAGGLVVSFQVGGEPLECFYHHLFTTDADYIALAEELGLGDAIEWLPSRMGMYSRGQLWDFGTPASLLRFSPLSWPDKARFAWSTLRLRHLADYRRLEAVTARDWIVRHAGQRVYDTVWGPLLEQKFADMAEQVSMVWLWGKVYLRGRSRSPSGLGERLGYMRGGFRQLIEILVDCLRERDVELHLASPVLRIAEADAGLTVRTRKAEEVFSMVLFTAAPAELAATIGDSVPVPYLEQLRGLPHTGALCVVLELDRSLSPYYWINIADREFPFGGLMEHTNYIPAARYGGRRVLYISKYMFANNPLWTMRDDDVWRVYLPFLRRINPDFDESWVRARHHFKASNAQPVIPTHYPEAMPPFATPLPGLYHACMAQIYPEDRGQNYAVRAGNRAAMALLADGGAQ
jgi:protoporphyrinogen oxidase